MPYILLPLVQITKQQEHPVHLHYHLTWLPLSTSHSFCPAHQRLEGEWIRPTHHCLVIPGCRDSCSCTHPHQNRGHLQTRTLSQERDLIVVKLLGLQPQHWRAVHFDHRQYHFLAMCCSKLARWYHFAIWQGSRTRPSWLHRRG